MSDGDIAIVGGGLVGASLAVALAGGRHRPVLIESAPFPDTMPARRTPSPGMNAEADPRDPVSRSDASPATPPGPDGLRPGPVSGPRWDERCIALNDASFRIFTRLGVWPALAADAQPIRATHISERGRFGVARFEAAEVGIEALGYNVPLRAIGRALWTRLREVGVDVRCPASVVEVEVGREGAELELEAGQDRFRLTARLIAAADGARSAVREKLGIDAAVRDYGQHGIVSAVRIGRPHGGVAYERFTPDGPIAVLPKAVDACSLIWTVPSDRAEMLLALSDADYMAAAQETFGGRLGPFLELGKRVAHPLARTLATAPTAMRTVFLGNAAQSLHPVAAQGFNLGLRDVAGLSEALAGAVDPGTPEVLDAYAERRARDRGAASDFTDLLVRAFSNRVPGLAQTRHWGLLGLELIPPLRARVMRQHLGHHGLPAGL